MTHRDPVFVVLADPGWEYDTRGKRGCIVNADGNGIYSMTTMDDLARMHIPGEADLVFFCWLTLPLVDRAMDLVEHQWGFTYRGIHIVWHKCKKNDPRGSVFGVGAYTASNVEILCLFTRGERFVHLCGANLRIDVPPTIHSEKPLIAYWAIEYFCEQHRLGMPMEMFARCTSRPGWRYDAGSSDQHETFADMVDLPRPSHAVPHARPTKRPKTITTTINETCRPRAPDGRRFACLVVLIPDVSWLSGFRFDLMLAPDSVVMVAATSESMHILARALRDAQLEYKTLLFYELDSDDPSHNTFWLAASPPGSRIGKVRKAHRSQIVNVSGQTHFEKLRTLLRAATGLFDDTAVVDVRSPTKCIVVPVCTSTPTS